MSKQHVRQLKQRLLNYLLSIILVFFNGAIHAATLSDDAGHSLAITHAKAGAYKQALSIIKPLADKHQKPSRFYYDYLSILGWAKQHKSVIGQSVDINVQQAPLYVVKTIAIALRDQRLFVDAERLYRTITARFPNNVDGKIGLTLVLIDQQKYTVAKRQLTVLSKQHPKNTAVLYALAYLHESKQEFLQAIPIYEQISAINPADRSIHKKTILALNKIGASHLAFSLIKDPSLFTPAELASIRANMAAHQIRWGQVPSLKEEHRFDETDIAIRDLKNNIKDNQQRLGEVSPITLNERFDLLVALRNRVLMKAVIQQYESLISDNINVPNYSKNAYCDALLYQERPNDAENCYVEIIATGHQNINAKVALFYAYLENEEFTTAQQWIKKIAAEQPSSLKGIGKRKILKGNPKKTQTESASALSIAFADDLHQAHQLFTAMHGTAPYNTSLRKELSNVYYWRGWPRRAQIEYAIGLHQEPKSVGFKLGQSRNWLALKEYPLAEKTISELVHLYPEDKGVRKQSRLWAIHNMREFKTDITFDKSNGGTNGSRGMTIDSYLYSSPLDYNYRAYLHHRHAQAEFTEGDSLLNHAGIGIEYTAPNVLLSAELHKNHFDNNRVGLSLAGQYSYNDYLSTSFEFETLSKNTPLRALNQGIYAKSLTLGAQYRWHESRSVGTNVSYSKFSDGNKRKSIGGFWNERWHNQYNYKFSTRVDLFSSNNSKNNVIYFNPDRDYAASIAFENDFLTWRRYEDSFNQRLILSTGLYNQKNFSTGTTWGIQYEHRWKADNRFELIYGIKRTKNLYDGNHELGWNYYLTLDWRF
ncbi:MAG: poly-beta-1,6 N-acetyl-D-glucosamine export porin PgaA [Piscirickettsiaceae bacterium]|nr:MAG: poly-beta-1,6 N-acetyl-D-glucosamine export porin PgaA [Piscirickettsiaceae bacterium]